MTDLSRAIGVKPIITYPREVQVGKTYLMTIDLQPEEGFEWQYQDEEYPIYCKVDSKLFSSKPVGEPVIVLHRFGGSYGEAKFLLTAGLESGQGNIKVVLINAWGVPVKILELESVHLLSRELIHLEPHLTIERELKITDSVAKSLEKSVSEVPTFGEKEQKTLEVGCAVILTTLPVESLAVRAYLTKLREEIHPQGTIYEIGEFASDERVWDVGLIEVDAANPKATLEVNRAIAYFRPDIILSVGVAVGLKDVSLGDVVVCTKIYRYELGKTKQTFKSKPEINLFGFRLVQRARAEARKNDWLERLKSVNRVEQEMTEFMPSELGLTQNSEQLQSLLSRVPDPVPRVFVAPIASGKTIIASAASKLFRFLRQSYGDAIAIEMEEVGFIEAAYASQRVPTMVIRGISDLIDNKIKIDKTVYQEIASHHASAFAFEILAKFQRDRNSDLNVTSTNIATRFNRFIQNIQPSKKDVAEANQQANYVVERLKNRIDTNGQFGVEKVLKAGSYARLTALRRVNNNGSDVDIVAYFTGEGATKRNFGKLRDFIVEQLLDIYPSKSQESFAAFRGNVRIQSSSGLSIDVVPVIKDDTLEVENGGWFPYIYGRRYANRWQLTSVTCHKRFTISRTAKSKEMSELVRFNRLVQLVKWWNNQQKQLRQPSILCELITAAAFDAYGVTDEWQSSLRQVFFFLLEHQFLEPIVFDDYYDTNGLDFPSDRVIVLDPANPENNFTRNWTERTRLGYLERVQDAYDSMMEAQNYELDGDTENAVAMWCRVFGDAFRSLSEEN